MQNLTENLKHLEPASFARGGFAVVHKAVLYPEDPLKRQNVAVKFLDVRNIVRAEGAEGVMAMTKYLRRWQREITAGRSVSHPNILAFLGFCNNPDPEYREFAGIVLPFCKNGNASDYLYKHPEVDRMHILVSVCAALFALHNRSSPVVHGDIKASNILIDNQGNPLLADFGLSRVCNTRGFTTKNIMGSTRWMSVELLRACTDSSQNGIPADDHIICITEASDIWAFAMTILEMLTGRPPFTEYNFDGGVFFHIVADNARPRRPDVPRISDAVWTLLEHCWAEEPAARPDARHVGLVLDIIYGLGRREVEPHVVCSILGGTLDNVAVQSSQGQQLDSASLPYRCKWLHCSRAFRCIDDCVGHECDEFSRRWVAVDL